MARVNQRLWNIPGQRTRRKAWGFTAQIDGKQVRRYQAEWTREDAEAELAKALLKVEPEKPKGPGITLAEAVDRYLASKTRKRTITADRRQLNLLKAEFGAETPLAELTASRISEYKAKRLAAVRKLGEGETAVEQRLTAAAINRPLALLRHLLRLAHEEWEAIDNVPRIRLEKEPQGRLRWLTQEEITRLLDAAAKSRNKELRPVVIVALNTGLRLGELLGLTWERVDLSRGVIRLEVTKSGRRREVPLNGVLRCARHSQPQGVWGSLQDEERSEGLRERRHQREARRRQLPHAQAHVRVLGGHAGGQPEGASGAARACQSRHDDEVRAPGARAVARCGLSLGGTDRGRQHLSVSASINARPLLCRRGAA